MASTFLLTPSLVRPDAPENDDNVPSSGEEESGIYRRDGALTEVLRLEAVAATSRGRRRKNNEDHFSIAPRLGLFTVADGMGGHAAGEVASALATNAVTAFLDETGRDPDRTWPYPIERERSFAENRVAAAIRHANRCIVEEASKSVRVRGMGTTIVALHASSEGIVVAHVGDSRAYRIRGSEMHRLTEDHSLFALLEKSHAASPNDPPVTEGKNVLMRALGADQEVAVDTSLLTPRPGDIYLLCSDGLHGVVPDADVFGIVTATRDAGRALQDAAQTLIDVANARGGPDNVTAVLVRCHEAERRDTREAR